MKPADVADALVAMSKEEMREVAELAARSFSQKAEQIYEKDPENNGRVAQEYADVADLMNEIALIGTDDNRTSPLEDDLNESSSPTTVTQAVAATKATTKNPWAGR